MSQKREKPIHYPLLFKDFILLAVDPKQLPASVNRRTVKK